MKKHIVGIVIFSFIVGVTAIIASFFVKMPTIPALDPVFESTDYIYRGDRDCKRKKKRRHRKSVDQSVSLKVTQALFDARSKRLDTQFAIERSSENTETVNVVLQFFVYDEFGVQHIANEFISLNPNFDMGDVAVSKNTSSFKWLNNLESRENLYVMARAINGSLHHNNSVDFDPSEATAVLLKPMTASK